jgi:phage-related tail fiber protein
MTKEFYSLITNIGLGKIQEALNNGTKLDLKYIAVGDSNGAYYEPSEEQMALKSERYRAEITELTSLTAKSLIPASVGGFYMREFGIFDSENNLILVGKQPETYKPVETEGSFKELWIKVVIVAINPNVIELKIDPTIQMASQSWVLNLFNGHTHSDLMPIWLYDTNNDVKTVHLYNIKEMKGKQQFLILLMIWAILFKSMGILHFQIVHVYLLKMQF